MSRTRLGLIASAVASLAMSQPAGAATLIGAADLRIAIEQLDMQQAVTYCKMKRSTRTGHLIRCCTWRTPESRARDRRKGCP